MARARSRKGVEDWFWVYKLSYQGEEVYVAINRDDDKNWSPPSGYVDGLGNCSNGVVPILTSCIFVRDSGHESALANGRG